LRYYIIENTFCVTDGKKEGQCSAEKYAKFWLTPIQLAEAFGYNKKEVQRIQNIIAEHSELLKEAWNEHFAH